MSDGTIDADPLEAAGHLSRMGLHCTVLRLAAIPPFDLHGGVHRPVQTAEALRVRPADIAAGRTDDQRQDHQQQDPAAMMAAADV